MYTRAIMVLRIIYEIDRCPRLLVDNEVIGLLWG